MDQGGSDQGSHEAQLHGESHAASGYQQRRHCRPEEVVLHSHHMMVQSTEPTSVSAAPLQALFTDTDIVYVKNVFRWGNQAFELVGKT